MKKIITVAVALLATLGVFGQKPSLMRPRMELVNVETETNGTVNTELEVFYMDDESPRVYYMSVGNLGIGGDIVQLELNPVYELFIPLGNTLEEAIAKMEEIKDFYKQPRHSTMELPGIYAVGYPGGNVRTVKLTRRQMLSSKLVEFSIPVEGDESLVWATYIGRNDFGGLLTSLKVYKKLHPKVK